METEVTIRLPTNLYHRTQQFAELHHQEVDKAITTLIEQGLANSEIEENDIDWTEPDEAVARERAVYLALHPQLVKTHLGKYVAIYGGNRSTATKMYKHFMFALSKHARTSLPC
jgi:hypothetical protein